MSEMLKNIITIIMFYAVNSTVIYLCSLGLNIDISFLQAFYCTILLTSAGLVFTIPIMTANKHYESRKG
jgi:hypothetical protein